MFFSTNYIIRKAFLKMKMKNIFSKNLEVKKLTFKQKLKLKKLQLGIVLTLFLEILAFSKASYANSVDDYFEGLPKSEAPSRLEQSSKSEVTLVSFGKGNPNFSTSPQGKPGGTPREVNEIFYKNNVQSLVDTALNNQEVKKEFGRIKQRLEDGINPIDIGQRSTNLPSAGNSGNIVLIKASKGRYLVQVIENKVNILGIADRSNDQNTQTFKAVILSEYGIKLNY